MLKSYLKLAFRNITNSKAHSVINIIGLSIGLASTILIVLYAYDEFTYDRYHKNANHIYRVSQNWKSKESITPWARTSASLGPSLATEFSEKLQAVRIRKNPRTDLLAYDDHEFYEDRLFFADSNVFKIFSFPLIKGNPEKALIEINSILLTEKNGEKVF